MSSIKRPLSRPVLWLILIIVSAVLVILTAEICARLVPGPWSTDFFARYDPVLGTWHLENFTGNNIQRDYSIRGIRMNYFGMRDSERSLAKREGVTRIAVLGDSFVEGLQVQNDEVLTKRIENILGRDVEVLNFGVAGFGTTQEYLTYVEKVRQFKPDIVILAFLSSNDMRNNSRELEKIYNEGGSREMPFLERKDGSWSLVPPPEKIAPQNPIILFLKRNFVLYRFLWHQKQRLAIKFAPDNAEEWPSATVENASAYLSRLFADPSKEEKIFQEAWAATDELIRMLNVEVKKDGASFVVVALPSQAHIEPDPRAALENEYKAKLPPEFDIDYPEGHLKALTEKEKISFLHLAPVFREYRDKNKMQPPYFSFKHDGHWSSIGHNLAARTIADYLQKAMLIP